MTCLATGFTVDYILGNSNINLLDASKEDIQNLTEKELSGSLMENINTIFEVGKEKFNMTEVKMATIKALVIKQFLKETEESEKNTLLIRKTL